MSDRDQHRSPFQARRRRAIPPDPVAVKAAYARTRTRTRETSGPARRIAITAAILGLFMSLAVPQMGGLRLRKSDGPVEFDGLSIRSRTRVRVDVRLRSYGDASRARLVAIPVLQGRKGQEDEILHAERVLASNLDHLEKAVAGWISERSRTELLNVDAEFERFAETMQKAVFPGDEARLVDLVVAELEFY